MIKPIKSPCHDCKWRSPYCHADCDKYALYVNYREQIRKIKHLEHDARGILIEHAVQRKANSYRRHKNG